MPVQGNSCRQHVLLEGWRPKTAAHLHHRLQHVHLQGQRSSSVVCSHLACGNALLKMLHLGLPLHDQVCRRQLSALLLLCCSWILSHCSCR